MFRVVKKMTALVQNPDVAAPPPAMHGLIGQSDGAILHAIIDLIGFLLREPDINDYHHA